MGESGGRELSQPPRKPQLKPSFAGLKGLIRYTQHPKTNYGVSRSPSLMPARAIRHNIDPGQARYQNFAALATIYSTIACRAFHLKP